MLACELTTAEQVARAVIVTALVLCAAAYLIVARVCEHIERMGGFQQPLDDDLDAAVWDD